MSKAVLCAAGTAVAAFSVLAAIQPASALPIAHGFLTFVPIGAVSVDTSMVSPRSSLGISPGEAVTLMPNTLPSVPGFGSMTTSFDVVAGSLTFTFPQVQTLERVPSGTSDAGSDTPPVRAAPIPEPASLALLGSALVGFGVVRRRKA